jgi:streptogramin lyase
MRRFISCVLWAVQLQVSFQQQWYAAGQYITDGDVTSLPVKAVTEYPLPAAAQTHEILAVNDNLLVISQQTDGSLVKVVLDDFGRPIGARKWLITNPYSGLHGLYLQSGGGSSSGSGSNYTARATVWATVQFDNAILRIDVGDNDINSQPTVIDTIPIPSPAFGPHGIMGNNGQLWVTCKDSSHVVRINTANTNDSTVFPVSGRPIFSAVHPSSGDIYASLDLSSKIWHYKNDGGKGEEIEIPAAKGSTPVGLIPGSDDNAWVVLLGNKDGGSGTFGRINRDASIDWFTMSSNIGKTAPLIHLAFDGDPSRFWLLGSSTVFPAGVNAIFTVKIEANTSGGTASPRIAIQNTIMLPTQWSWTHRMISHRGSLYVTELTTSTLAHISGAVVDGWPVSETVDQFADYGQGLKATTVYYNNTV